MSERAIGPVRKTFYIIVIILAVFLIYLFGFREMRFFRVPSTSMIPTLLPNDMLMTLAQDVYERGDIIVFSDPNNPREYLVKRVVAEPGDAIAIESGGLILNGHYASEPYIAEPMRTSFTPPFPVPSNSVFVLGDNRNNREDSRTWGEAVPVESIVGRVRLVYLPFRRSRMIDRYPLFNAAGE